jgi:hypothetical protein
LRERHDNGVTQGARLIEEESRLGEETVSLVVLSLAVRVVVHAASFSDL